MFRRVLSYAGKYRRTIAASVAVMLLAVALSVLPYLFLFQLIAPLLLHRAVGFAYAAWRIAGIALCGVLYAVLYQKGLSLSHTAAYHNDWPLFLILLHMNAGAVARISPDKNTAPPHGITQCVSGGTMDNNPAVIHGVAHCLLGVAEHLDPAAV